MAELQSYSWRSGGSLLQGALQVEVRPGRLLRLLTRPPAPGKATLLLVHGSAGSLTQFLPLASALASQGCGVLAYDWLGCGGSAKPDLWEAYAFEEHLQDLVAVWTQHMLTCGPGPRFLVAHSFGTHLAIQLAGRVDSVSGLILLSGARNFPEGHPIFRLPVWVLNHLQSSLTKVFLELALAPGSDPGLVEQEEKGCNSNPMHMCKAYYRQVKNAGGDDFSACANIPTLVVRGEADGIVSRADSEELVKNMVGARQLETILGVSHNFMLESPGCVAELVLKFIASI